MSIKFSLVCECSAKFEGWFPGNKEYEEQVSAGKLLCPMCDSANVRKDIMAPNIGKKSIQKNKNAAIDTKQLVGDEMVMGGKARHLIRQIHKHVEKNFENVGKNFAKEARKAHRGDRDQEFYGKPSKKEIKDLVKEGIDLFQVPDIKDN
jgi:hypothetical protein